MNRDDLIAVFEQVRELVALPGNGFGGSSWQDTPIAHAETDTLLRALRSGTNPRWGQMGVFFAPTGPLQELSLSSGWADCFIALADRFDAAAEAPSEQAGD